VSGLIDDPCGASGEEQWLSRPCTVWLLLRPRSAAVSTDLQATVLAVEDAVASERSGAWEVAATTERPPPYLPAFQGRPARPRSQGLNNKPDG